MRVYEKLQPLVSNIDLDDAQGNIATTKGAFPELLTPDNLGKIGDPDTTVWIVNPGPSARTPDVLEKLNSRKDESGKCAIIVVAGMGYSMLDKGLKHADACVFNRPDTTFVQHLPTLGDEKIDYLMASMVPAGVNSNNLSVFDVLSSKGCVTKLWHAHIDGVAEFGDDVVSVGTGSGAPVAALALYSAMGYRKFEIFGMDGSSAYDGIHGDQTGIQSWLQSLKDNEMAVRVGGKQFTVAKEFWPQTKEVLSFLQNYPDAVHSLRFSGNTANAAIFNTPDGKPNLDIEILDAPVSARQEPGYNL